MSDHGNVVTDGVVRWVELKGLSNQNINAVMWRRSTTEHYLARRLQSAPDSIKRLVLGGLLEPRSAQVNEASDVLALIETLRCRFILTESQSDYIFESSSNYLQLRRRDPTHLELHGNGLC